jgi:type III secretory pathway component EscS
MGLIVASVVGMLVGLSIEAWQPATPLPEQAIEGEDTHG